MGSRDGGSGVRSHLLFHVLSPLEVYLLQKLWTKSPSDRRFLPALRVATQGLARVSIGQPRCADLGTVEHQEELQMSSAEGQVTEVIADQFEASQITREMSFVDDLSADSLDMVELMMELEEEFDIDISEDAAKRIKTVGQAIDEIEKLLEDRPV
jgi:acyl carrier protein